MGKSKNKRTKLSDTAAQGDTWAEEGTSTPAPPAADKSAMQGVEKPAALPVLPRDPSRPLGVAGPGTGTTSSADDTTTTASTASTTTTTAPPAADGTVPPAANPTPTGNQSEGAGKASSGPQGTKRRLVLPNWQLGQGYQCEDYESVMRPPPPR